jgi:hypothetical protein
MHEALNDVLRDAIRLPVALRVNLPQEARHAADALPDYIVRKSMMSAQSWPFWSR